jgi:hypothetical protein
VKFAVPLLLPPSVVVAVILPESPAGHVTENVSAALLGPELLLEVALVTLMLMAAWAWAVPVPSATASAAPPIAAAEMTMPSFRIPIISSPLR